MQVKGWKKCNVYCCTIFSNKRTQNLFVIVFMWTLPDNIFPLTFFCYGSGGSCNFFTCIPFHLALLFLPSICIDSISVFAPPTCSRSHTFCSSPSVSLSSVPVERGHKSGRLCWFSQMWTNSCRGKTATQCCSRANKTLSSLCYNFVRNVYIFLFLCIT